MTDKKTYPLFTMLGAGIGAWAAVQAVRRIQLAEQGDYFEGKVVLITGASRGLGQHLALTFAQRGAHLVLAARSEDELRLVADACESLNIRINTLIVPIDVTNEDDLQLLLDKTYEQFGYIDILINNAGIRQGGTILEQGAENVHRQLAVNLMAPINLTLLALPGMIKRNNGHIVNIVSLAGSAGEPYFIPYGTSKHGLFGFSEGLRRELDGTGINVLTVNPGFFESDMISEVHPIYQQLGMRLSNPQIVAQKILDGIVLNLPEVHNNLVEKFGARFNKLAPTLFDLYWRMFKTPEMAEQARQQHTD